MQKIQILHMKSLPERMLVQSSNRETVTNKKKKSAHVSTLIRHFLLKTFLCTVYVLKNSEVIPSCGTMTDVASTNMECDQGASFMENDTELTILLNR